MRSFRLFEFKYFALFDSFSYFIDLSIPLTHDIDIKIIIEIPNVTANISAIVIQFYTLKNIIYYGLLYLYLITYAGKGGAAFIVGILKAIFNSAGFPTSKIEYYTNSDDIDDNNTKSLYPSTLFFIVFKQEAIK